MNPILFPSDATTFQNLGIGVLSDVTTGHAVRILKGADEIEFSYPITGQHYNEILLDRIVQVKPDELSGLQAYRIYRISKPINGIVKIYGQHISYDLNGNPVEPFELDNVNATTALTAILNNCHYAHNFTAVSTVAGTKNLYSAIPKSARAWLGEDEGCILNIFGGEYEFDNFTIRHKSRIGSDTGVRISYGKNLTNITDDSQIDKLYTAIYPYAFDNNGTYYELTEKTVTLNNFNSFGSPRVLNLDLSKEFEDGEIITDSKLRQKALNYAEKNNINTIAENIVVSFVQLWQSKEYETIANLERVAMGDTVIIYYADLGVNATARVIKTDYDFVNEKYNNIEIGKAKSNFAQTLAKINSQITTMQNTIIAQGGEAERLIREQTAILNGSTGGYIYTVTNSDGQPEQRLFMNSPDVSTATQILRINKDGIGFSTNGGTSYNTAWTVGGVFNADYIQTGTLNASLIKTGTLDASRITVTNLSASSINSGTLDASVVSVTNINASNITSGVINADLITAGTLNGSLIKTGTISDVTGNTQLNLANGEITIGVVDTKTSATGNRMVINSSGLTLYDSNGTDLAEISIVAGKGFIIAENGTIASESMHLEGGALAIYNPSDPLVRLPKGQFKLNKSQESELDVDNAEIKNLKIYDAANDRWREVTQTTISYNDLNTGQPRVVHVLSYVGGF